MQGMEASERRAGEAAAVEKVFVAVPLEHSAGRNVLAWAIRHLAPAPAAAAVFVLCHVHVPPQTIPMMGAEVHASRMRPEVVNAYRKAKMQESYKQLDAYHHLCSTMKVKAEKLVIEKDDVVQGLVDLIAQYSITKLVMGAGAGADKHYSKKMKSPRSKIATGVMKKANPLCRILFVCKGRLICTREAGLATILGAHSPNSSSNSTSEISDQLRLQSLPPDGDASLNLSRGTRDIHMQRSASDRIGTEVSSSRTISQSRIVLDDYGISPFRRGSGNEVDSEVLPPMLESDDDALHVSSYHEKKEMGLDLDLSVKLQEAQVELKNLREKAYHESSRRHKAEEELIKYCQKAEMSSWLGVRSAMEYPMSSSLGAIGPLLRKLDLLLPPEYRLPKPVKDRVELLKEDLEEISVALVEQSMVHFPNEMANYWMNEVREISYDIDDFIDDMMLTHTDAAHTKIRSVHCHRVGRVKIAWIPKTLKPCTWAAKIAELRTLVREASERHDMYLDGCTSSSRCVFTWHGQVPALYAADYLVGIDDSKMKLVELLTNKAEQQLKVVAIVGPAGVGKTTLAKQVYRELGGQFECRAFMRASRKPDMRRLLGGILSQVQQCSGPSDSCTVQDLIDNLTKHLQDKRYVIVIDDLWETTAWDIVTSAFPDGNNHSRIVTTAEIEGLALECCDYQSNNILKMKPLGREDSGELFFNMVFGPECSCPEQLKEVSDIAITKCAGLPLATICVAGLLASQLDNSEVWQHVQEYLFSNLSTNSTLEERLQEILKLSYNSLPHYLKTCLMHLSMYPEGYTMWKHDLVKQWVAECFIIAIEGEDTEEVAESYFDELVNRGMIQPVEINDNDEVLSCTLHHVVLDLITHKSNEEKFITALDYSQTITGLHCKARRLSLHFSNTRYATKPAGLTLSQVRSLVFFGILKCMPSIVEFKLLRVLVLQFWGDLIGCTSFNLTRICRLFQLRYLKISCDVSVEVELPAQMRRLQYLETIKINARVSAVPLDLPGLLHLSVGDKTHVTDGIGRIKSLRTLEYFDLGKNSEKSVLSLGELINLHDLHLTYSTVNSPELLKRKLAALASCITKLVNLKSVTLAPGALDMAIYHDCSSSVSSLPVFLQRLELMSPICILSRIPEWIGQLRKLCILKVVVSELLMKDMDILTGLPALTVFSLYVRQPTAESIIFKRGAFLALKCFKYRCGVLCLAFQKEALPNLQRLELSFNAHKGEQYGHLLAGIEHLSNLKEIAGISGATAGADESDRRAAESAFKDAIRKHPRFPSYDNVKRVDRVD